MDSIDVKNQTQVQVSLECLRYKIRIVVNETQKGTVYLLLQDIINSFTHVLSKDTQTDQVDGDLKIILRMFLPQAICRLSSSSFNKKNIF